MESKDQKKKLTYDELNRAASELHVQYQKLMAEYQKAMVALDNRSFELMSFFLQCLFKVVDHEDKYTPEFSKWAIENIQSALVTFSNEVAAAKDSEKSAEDKEEKA